MQSLDEGGASNFMGTYSHAQTKTIVVADDDLESRSYLEMALVAQGYDVRMAEDGEEALRCLDQDRNTSLLLMDVMMPHMNGIQTLEELRRRHSDLPVLLLSGEAQPASLTKFLERDGVSFLEKSAPHDTLMQAIEDLLRECKSDLPEEQPRYRSIGEDSFMKRMDSMLRQISASDVPVLMQGETGVGKEVMARQLHAYSRRAKKAFVKVNCAALPSELVESELFGYERGAFTGAFKDRPGRFELAQGGTILLDEIGDMDVRLQAKLLQVLQDNEFHRLGSRELVRVDVRVMAATHQDLRKAIQEGRFREDLYYRLNVINLRIPPIRERKGEIIWLAQTLLEKHSPADVPPPSITPALEQAMLDHDWPGNIRELENTMRRYLVMRDPEYMIQELRSLRRANQPSQVTVTTAPAAAPVAEPVAPAAAAAPVVPASALQDAERRKREAERTALLKALEATHWNRKQAATLLDIDYKAFLYKMKKLGVGSKPDIA